ncbi:hypothetical protein BDZ88DRAFT_241659 [Geranomyces variabilis]|nr:hypothetical protein BDZ88DRAFT_241659 [Geranomyces variabilis]
MTNARETPQKLAAACSGLQMLLDGPRTKTAKNGREMPVLTSSKMKAISKQLLASLKETLSKNSVPEAQISKMFALLWRCATDESEVVRAVTFETLGGALNAVHHNSTSRPLNVMDKLLETIETDLATGCVDKEQLGNYVMSPFIDLACSANVSLYEQKQIFELVINLLTKKRMAATLTSSKNVDLQLVITELLFRLFPKSAADRKTLAKSLSLPVAMADIRGEQFHKDARLFVNVVNAKNDGISTFPVSVRAARIECVVERATFPLQIPSNADSLWLDFNVNSLATTAAIESVGCIPFFCRKVQS